MEQMQTSAKSQQSQYENIPTLQGPASQSGGFFFLQGTTILSLLEKFPTDFHNTRVKASG